MGVAASLNCGSGGPPLDDDDEVFTAFGRRREGGVPRIVVMYIDVQGAVGVRGVSLCTQWGVGRPSATTYTSHVQPYMHSCSHTQRLRALRAREHVRGTRGCLNDSCRSTST